jgi:serum/glucocorticoid-regulated kinase 2
VSHFLGFLREKYPKVKAWKTSPPNFAVDYYLTLNNKDLSFLNGQSLALEPYRTQPQHQVSLASFDILHCIGTGGFSKVFLCRFKHDGLFYAMKVIEKSFILRNKKRRIVQNEKCIMQELRHPFIIEMKFAFESASCLVFVLEFCPGGEFRVMSEQAARLYLVEILLGLEEVHGRGVVYRDFKPENILIDIEGHVRIADFGLAKPGIGSVRDKAYSFCGSPEYMPPEMILKYIACNQGKDTRCPSTSTALAHSSTNW